MWPELAGCTCLSVRAAEGACVGRIGCRCAMARPEYQDLGSALGDLAVRVYL